MQMLRRATSPVKSPRFLVPCVLVLALGLSAALTGSTLVDETLLRPLPGVGGGGRLLSVEFVTREGSVPFSPQDLSDLQSSLQSLESVFSFSVAHVNLGLKGSPPKLAICQLVTDGFFPGLGASIAFGRPFTGKESSGDQELAAVISHRLWLDSYGGGIDVLGQAVYINGVRATVVGVAVPGFSGVSALDSADVWLPVSRIGVALPYIQEFSSGDRIFHTLYGRLAESADTSKITAELGGFAASLQEAGGTNDVRPVVNEDPRRPAFLSQYLSSILRPLSGVLFLVLVAALANAGSLVLARGLSRGDDCLVRHILGASPRQLGIEALLEGLFVAFLGSAAAVLLTSAAFSIFNLIGLATAFPGFEKFSLSPAPLLAVLAMAAVWGLATGMVSFWSGTIRMIERPRESSYSLTRPARLRSLLVIVQLGVTFALLVACGGLSITLQRFLDLDLGMDLADVHSFSIQPELNRYDEKETRQLYLRMLSGLRSRTGIDGVAMVQFAPFDGSRRPIRVRPKQEAPGADWVTVLRNRATSGYFGQLGVPFLAGDDFPSDLAESSRGLAAVIVTRSLAESFWPGTSGVGRVLEIQGGGERLVTAVVEDHRAASPFKTVPLLYEQMGHGSLPGRVTVVFRGPRGEREAAQISRDEVTRHDRNLALFAAGTLRDRFEDHLVDHRFLSILSLILAVAALLISSAGLYATLSWNFIQRRREFGIRMAIGSGKRQIVVLSLRYSLGLTVKGLFIGTGLLWFGSAWIAARLHHVSLLDSRVVGLALAIVLGCSLGASFDPIRRALAVNPALMLRDQ